MSKCQISPICSYFGRYLINQYFWYDFFETIEDLRNNINKYLFDSRYDALISKYDQEISKKLNELNIFIIGAGAIGCGLFKQFASSGISKKNYFQNYNNR